MANKQAMTMVEKYTKVIRECEEAIEFLEKPDAVISIDIAMSGNSQAGHRAVKSEVAKWLRGAWEDTGRQAMLSQFRYRMKEAIQQIKTYSEHL